MIKEYVGQNGQIQLRDDSLLIKRGGMLALFTHGFKGDKSIPYASITAVQFKPAGAIVAGYIQFSLLGGIEGRGGLGEATYDENSVAFGLSKNGEFEELRQEVERRCGATRPVAQQQPLSTAMEIERLAALKESGVLTAEEFDQAKRKVLGLP